MENNFLDQVYTNFKQIIEELNLHDNFNKDDLLSMAYYRTRKINTHNLYNMSLIDF